MDDIVERLRQWLSDNPACMEAADEIEALRAEVNVPIDALVGRVMKNSGGSANPETVKKVLMAIRGKRVSFVDTPKN